MFGVDRGEVFDVALADPQGHPLLFRALDGARQVAAEALGYYEQLRSEDAITKTSVVYWWRRMKEPLLKLYAELNDWLTTLGRLRP